MSDGKPAHYRSILVGAAIAGTGLALLCAAIAMGEAWANRHILPAWAYSWDVQLRVAEAARLVLGAIGLALILLAAPWAARAVAAGRGHKALGSALACGLAILGAFAATEAILHLRSWRSVQDRHDNDEPLRMRDAELGWRHVPNHHGIKVKSQRRIVFDTNPLGYRTNRAGAPIDLARPTVLLGGESIMLGYGLQYDETIGARLQSMTGLQTAVIAVNAYGTDQALLRLRHELPRFSNPVAVVIPFMARLLDRNLDRDRPHLDRQLRWQPGTGPSLRLVELARRAMHYRSVEAIDEGVAMTQAALKDVIRLARARGAQPIILVPVYLPETERERRIRRRVLDAAGIPYLAVRIPPSRRLSGDDHPDPRGAEQIAAAIADALVQRLEAPRKRPEMRGDVHQAVPLKSRILTQNGSAK